ncbi:MAG: hypothetical protein NC452_17560, partial [Eubacterium sp.]|nr:hypothetical protein [Eubacterium sp.]
MKLNAIAAIFKRNKRLNISVMSDGTQWITNGIAMYSMSGMPELTPAMVLKIFDIPEDKQGQWTCEIKPMSDNIKEICEEEFYTTKELFEKKKITIAWEG